MSIELKPIERNDVETVWKMQVKAEEIYGSSNWCLDAILQEKGNLHLYEKLGYHQTGRIDKTSDCMDIVFYEKD